MPGGGVWRITPVAFFINVPNLSFLTLTAAIGVTLPMYDNLVEAGDDADVFNGHTRTTDRPVPSATVHP